MKQKTSQIIFILLFIGLSIIYYYNLFGDSGVDKIFLTLSTFLFALFTGFFISRQAGRYGEIRKLTANFDGIMSSIYRTFGHFGTQAQQKAGEIIKNHYQMIVKDGWDYPFTHKTSTLTDLHHLIENTVKRKGTGGVKAAATTRMISGLHDAQKTRKNMVALREERIPNFQWVLIYILTIILILTVSAIPSAYLLLGSIIKAAFIMSIFVVIVLLKKLDELKLFAGNIREHSAQDVVDIIEDKK
jgi:amino acid transporter